MLLSMTGFGKAEYVFSHKKISVEIKTLNSKHFDANVRLSNTYKSKEVEIRQQLQGAFSRGKIDCSLYVEHLDKEKDISFNTDVIKSYYQTLKSMADELGSEDELMSVVMRMPHVISTEAEDIDEDEWQELSSVLLEAIKEVTDFRKVEGKKLTADFEQRIKSIKNDLTLVKDIEKGRIKNIQASINEQLSELQLKVDENRFEQELIYYLEKLDISEEITRLNIHLDYFLEVMSGEVSQGKKLGFIAQEIGREINTIGSKANDADMQRLVVQMKDELEKIKEQMLNVL